MDKLKRKLLNPRNFLIPLLDILFLMVLVTQIHLKNPMVSEWKTFAPELSSLKISPNLK